MNLNATTQRSEVANILDNGFDPVSRDFAPLRRCVKNQN
jgi:hypothetical protein